MGQHLALDAWLKRSGQAMGSRLALGWGANSAVRAQHGRQHEQKAEQDGPSGDPVRARAQIARRAGACAPAGLRLAGCRCVALDQHQAPAGPDFAHTATSRRNRRQTRARRDPALTCAPIFDPLAYILDVGPPRAGLGSSWHRRVMLTVRSAAEDGLRRSERQEPHGGLQGLSVPGRGGQEVGDRFGVATLV
jgi:hypothetical protein